MQQAPPVPPRGSGRRAPPPLNTQNGDNYNNNNNRQYYGNSNLQYNNYSNNNGYYNNSGSISYQGNYDNNYLQFPNNTRHQRMNSSSSGIGPSPQQINSYPPPQQSYNNNYSYPKYSPSVQSSPSSSMRGPPPKINYSSSMGSQVYPNSGYSPINNSGPIQQNYGYQNQRNNYYPQNNLQTPNSYNQEQKSPEIYISSSDTSLPNPPRKYIPANAVSNDPPPPPRRQVVPPSNHKIMPAQVSPSRSNGGSSPSLSPQLNGRTSPIPPQRRSMLVKTEAGNTSPAYRYSYASYSPNLGEQVRQYQRGRNTSLSSQVNQLSLANQGTNINSSSPNSVASATRYEYNSSPINEESGIYKSSNHKRNYSYSSSITVPNMDLNENSDEGYLHDHHISLTVKDNNGISRQSVTSQISGISQVSSISKLSNNYNEIKENDDYNDNYESSDDDIEEAKAKNEKRISIEAEDLSKLLQDNSTVILDEKTLEANTEKTYKNLDPTEAKELQRLSLNLKNIDDSTFNFDDFDLDAIANDYDKKNKNEDNDISVIKGDEIASIKDDKGKLSEEIDRSNQALLNVLSDEIKDLFKQVDENDAKDRPEKLSLNPIERIQQQSKVERNDSILSRDSIQLTDIFTHLNNDYNENDENNSPNKKDSQNVNDHNIINNHNSLIPNNGQALNNTSIHDYQYDEYPSYRNSINSNNESVYYADDRSSFISYSDSRSIKTESMISPSPSLDPGITSVPPKRPPRYYEMNNNNQRNDGYGPSTSPSISPGAAPSVPPRRHYKPNEQSSSLSRPQRRQSLEITQPTPQAPPAPPRTSQSQQGNRRIINSNSSSLPATLNSIASNVNDTYYSSQSPVNEIISKSEPVSKSNTAKTTKSTKSLGEESIKEEKFEDDFVYHSGDIREKFPLVYHSANMSEIAATFRKKIKLVKHIKDSIEYMQSFSGYDAVSALADILGTEDRKVAQTTGQALEEQGMFHDVTYLHKLLDSHYHYYQFEDLAKPIAILERKETERLNPNDRASLMRKLSERKGAKKEFEENDPIGVLVNIAQCYSPTCTDESPCYSYSCPRRRIMETITAKETAGRFANMAMTIGLQTTWSTSLGKSYVGKMSHEAIKRQEIMYEFIRTEKEYVNDLQSVIKYMIGPLRHGKVPGIDNRFVDSVFGNIEEISQVNSDFYEGLRKIQKRKPVLESMGDVVKEHVVNFRCYIKYGESQPSAKQILQVQKNKNPQLNSFLKECQNMPQFRRLPIESFLARPTTRLGRYPILIRDILKNTSKNHRDQILLKEANTTIESILKEVNQVAGKETNRLKMDQWSELLRFEKKNDVSAVHFEDPKREYIREGKLSLIVHNYINEPSLDVTVLLLDNVLIITYEKNNNYHIYSKPIPISLLNISHSEEKKSLKPNDNHTSSKKLVVNNHGKNNGFESMGYIFTVKHLGVGTYQFFTPILSEQKAWVEAIQKQQELLPKPIAKEIVFFSHKKLDSPVQTIHRLKNGALLLANDIGLYVLINNSMMKPLLQLSRISQVESMEQFDILFILSNREVFAFSISLLLKGVYTNPNYLKHNKKISSNVSFIATGFCDEKFLLCCAKASANKTVVKMFEPKRLLLNPNYRKTYQKLYLTGDVVTNFKQFYIPSEGVNIRFLRRSLCVACIKSFEVVSIKNLTTQSLLNPNDVVFKNLLKSEYSPMNMFKTQQNDFLLCYNKIGFFIDKNGNRSRPNIFFKWNASPRAFAYRSPNIYVITVEYIAIWNEFDTKESKQIIAGNSMRLLLHDENQNLIYSRIEDGKQRLATIEIIKPPPVIVQTQMQLPPPQIRN